ncbi:MAG: heme NO-binding domain-containing protein [Bacteroidota bacterium]
MYGMVNRAIEQFIRKEHGEEVWERVASKASVSHEFISMEQYPDSVSVNLVVGLSEVTGMGPAQVLADVGEYWVSFAYNSEYGDLLDMAGDTLPEVLANLDEMHTRVGQSFEKLDTPSFWVSDLTEDSMILHYNSSRDGLAPMVVGLVRGLGNLLDTDVSVIQVGFKGDTGDHDEFAVAFAKKEKADLGTKPSVTSQT